MKVLIVEDEGMIAMLLVEMIEMLGLEIAGEASSVSEALALIDAMKPNAAIVDLKLRGEDSYPVMEKLRELGVPFAVASGYGGNIDHARAGEGMPIIAKPYLAADVEAALARF